MKRFVFVVAETHASSICDRLSIVGFVDGHMSNHAQARDNNLSILVTPICRFNPVTS